MCLPINTLSELWKCSIVKSMWTYVAKTIDNTKIAENDYNLSVSSYVAAKDNREQVDIGC
jgi:type I restriction-modification system DNA methylase subunit